MSEVVSVGLVGGKLAWVSSVWLGEFGWECCVRSVRFGSLVGFVGLENLSKLGGLGEWG